MTYFVDRNMICNPIVEIVLPITHWQTSFLLIDLFILLIIDLGEFKSDHKTNIQCGTQDFKCKMVPISYA